MVLCCLSLVSVLVTYHLMFVQIIFVGFRLLSGHVLGKSCPLGWLYICSFCIVSICIFCYFAVFVLRVGFWF